MLQVGNKSFQDWCDTSNSSASQHWYFPTAEQLAEAMVENKTLIDNYQTVGISSEFVPYIFAMFVSCIDNVENTFRLSSEVK